MIYWANIRSIVYFITLLGDFFWFVCVDPPPRMDTKRKYSKLIRNGFSENKTEYVRIWEYFEFEEMISERVDIVRSYRVRSCRLVSYYTSYFYRFLLAEFWT